MKIIKAENNLTTIEFDKNELTIINNALNEICNGAYALDDTEFGTLIGSSRNEALELLLHIHKHK